MQANILDDPTRSLPWDSDAEKGVLSCFLHTPDLLSDAQANVPDESFYHPANQLLFKVMKKFHEGGKRPVEYIALTNYLRDADLLDKIGGPGMLSELLNFVPTPAHYGYYKGILKDKLDLRRIIHACTTTVSQAYEHQEDLATFLSDAEERIASVVWQARAATASRGKSLVELMDAQIDEGATLLGDRYLCRGGGAMIVGQSGIGKSTMSAHQDMRWAQGLEAFGIQPTGPLRLLTIQAENDEGDLTEMVRGGAKYYNFTREQLEVIHKNTRVETLVEERGEVFLARLRVLVAEFRPDIVRIDPLHAFAGCKVEDAKEMGAFLRAGLNPILKKYQCGAIVVHHTPKPPKENDGRERTAMDFLYAGAGSAEITNWARALLVIEQKSQGVFAFHASKRGHRIGWRDPIEGKEFTRYFRHAREDGAMHWEAITDPEEVEAAAKSRGGKNPEAALLAEIPAVGPIDKAVLLTKANERSGIGMVKLKDTLRAMLQADDPKVFEWREKRARTNDLLRIWTSPQGPRA
jgi:hypothetical protein